MRYFIFLQCCFFMCFVQAQAPYGAIRGVWVAAQDSVLDSKTNIQKAVDNCKKAGINNIYVSTWNRGRTLYPSAIMMERFGIAIDPRFGKRDPLKELIDAAHVENIKVHAWFEYGFAAASGEDVYKRQNCHVL